MKKVKSFEEALGILEAKSPGIKEEYAAIISVKTRYSQRLIAEFKLMVIIEVLNAGWVPDWKNGNQRKWYPYFYHGALAGFGYVLTHDVASDANTYLGSRLCLQSRDLAEYMGETFEDLYQQMLLG